MDSKRNEVPDTSSVATQKSLFPEKGKGLPCMTLPLPFPYPHLPQGLQKRVGLSKPTPSGSRLLFDETHEVAAI